MTKPPMTVAQKIWIAVRFVIFGVGGFLAVFIGGVSLMSSFDSPSSDFLQPVLSVALTFVGGLMMMFGGGVWGRWAYCWVVFSLPVAGVTMMVVDRYLPGWDRYVPLGKFLGVLVFGAPMVVSYVVVRGYYRRQDARAHAAHEAQIPSVAAPKESE